MALTTEQAIAQLQLVQSGNTTGKQATGFAGLLQSGLNAALTYGVSHNAQIQAMINSLLVSKGVLSTDQEKQVVDLVAAEQKRQAAIKVQRTNATLLISGIAIVIITSTILIIKKRNNG